jgi:hypothetical protein
MNTTASREHLKGGSARRWIRRPFANDGKFFYYPFSGKGESKRTTASASFNLEQNKKTRSNAYETVELHEEQNKTTVHHTAMCLYKIIKKKREW